MTNSARIGKIIYVNSQVAAREPAPGALVQEQAPKLAAPPHGSQRRRNERAYNYQPVSDPTLRTSGANEASDIELQSLWAP